MTISTPKYLCLLIAVIVSTLFLYACEENPAETITNFHRVDNTNIYREGRPRQQGMKVLKKLGVRTIVNLEREIFEKVPAVIVVTHDVRMIEGFDCVYELKDGRIVGEKTNSAQN